MFEGMQVLQFSEILDDVLELSLMMLGPDKFNTLVCQAPEFICGHRVVRAKLAQIHYEAQEGSHTLDSCRRLYCRQLLDSLGSGPMLGGLSPDGSKTTLKPETMLDGLTT